MEQVLKSYLEHTVGAENVRENISMRTKTTLRIGGNARFYVEVQSKESLVRLVGALKYIDYPYFVIGLGANLLCPDEGYNGVVIRLMFKDIIDNQCFIYADAGATLRSVCKFACERELSGLEWAVGIPATIGGAVFMNAGAHGGEISQVVAMVDVLTTYGEIKTLDHKQLKFGHRKSVFHNKPDWVILGAYFYLNAGSKESIIALENEYLQKRKNTQPTEPNAGSVFRRPAPDFAVGKAIDELGLKGKAIGGAKVSEKHAGFIVNTGEATAADVLALIKLIKREVFKTYKVRLTPEIRVLKRKLKPTAKTQN